MQLRLAVEHSQWNVTWLGFCWQGSSIGADFGKAWLGGYSGIEWSSPDVRSWH